MSVLIEQCGVIHLTMNELRETMKVEEKKRCMTLILLQGLDNVENFIDDILIFTQSLDHYLQVLKEVLRRLRTRVQL